jgi:hypothetical protein
MYQITWRHIGEQTDLDTQTHENRNIAQYFSVAPRGVI